MHEGADSPDNERKFLHELASPVGAAMFLVEAVLESLQARPGELPDELLQLGEAYEALDRVKKLLQERRELLIKQGMPIARS